MGEGWGALCPADPLQLVQSHFWAQSPQIALRAGWRMSGMGWRLCPDVRCASSAFLLLVPMCPEQRSLKESRAEPGGDVQHRHRQG